MLQLTFPAETWLSAPVTSQLADHSGNAEPMLAPVPLLFGRGVEGAWGPTLFETHSEMNRCVSQQFVQFTRNQLPSSRGSTSHQHSR